MELVRGEDLGTVLRRDGPMPFARICPIMVQVCDALSEAHEIGIVHRDIKPENLIVSRTRDGRELVKVLDFGLAKLRDSEDLNQVTAHGSLVGTPFYMSPEQIRAEELDARSDIYSLGALLYRAITGEHPFTAATPVAVLTQHLTEPLEPPSLRRPDLAVHPEVEATATRAPRTSSKRSSGRCGSRRSKRAPSKARPESGGLRTAGSIRPVRARSGPTRSSARTSTPMSGRSGGGGAPG